jgi:hypothetical protein
MKKLIILVSNIALLASGMAFGQFAYNGKIQHGVLTNFEDAPGVAWDNRMIFSYKIDDFNSMWIRFRMRNMIDSANPGAASYNTFPGNYLLSSDAPFVDRAYLVTNVTGGLGMKDAPVAWKLVTGFSWEPGADLSDGVSPFEIADVYQQDLGSGGKQAIIANTFTFAKMLNVRANFAPNNWEAHTSGGWLVGADFAMPAGPGTLTTAFHYGASRGAAAGEGNIAVAAKYAGKSGDIAYAVVPQFRYNLDEDFPWGNLNLANFYGDTSVQYLMAVAANMQYAALANVKVGYLGYDGSMANRFEARVVLTPDKMFGIDVGTILNLDKDEYVQAGEDNMLQEIDMSGFVNVGKTQIRLGYLYKGAEGFNSPINADLARIGKAGSGLLQGGMYFETVVNF